MGNYRERQQFRPPVTRVIGSDDDAVGFAGRLGWAMMNRRDMVRAHFALETHNGALRPGRLNRHRVRGVARVEVY